MIIFHMKNKTYFFNPFIHYLIYVIAAILFSYSLDISMFDDGLRHIAFANNTQSMKSWGDIFPHSLFGQYDPWFLWHKLLSFFLLFVDYSHVHILVNSIVLSILMILLDIYLRVYCKYNFSSLTYIIVFVLIYLTFIRYVILRPDLMSGLFIMIALLLKNRFLPMFFLTLFYGPFYYLFFIYTGSIGLVNLVQKKWKSFFGVLIASFCVLVIHLFYDFDGYIYTIKNILLDQQLRMGLGVSEGKPLFEIFSHFDYFILLPVFSIIIIYIIYKNYNYFKNNTIALFLLITSILWINQIRYFILFLPLVYIFIFSIFINMNKKVFLRNIRKYYIVLKRYVSFSKKVKLFYFVAIPYTIVAIAYAMNSYSINNQIKEAEFFKNEKFNNKVILLNRLHVDVYKGLYVNPTLKFVPSCSVGWFDNSNKEIKDIYVRMQKDEGISENELKKLVKYVGADFYIHYMNNEKQVLDFDKLISFGIIPQQIFHNRIIFKIDKNKINE